MQKATRYAIVAAIVLLVLLIAGFVLAGIFGVLLDVLYIALITLAFFALVSTALLIYALLMLIRTITTVRNELKPLIASVQHTVGSVSTSVEETTEAVKETAKIASQTATTIGSTARLTTEVFVAPSVRAVALLVGGQQMFRVFFGKGRTRRRYEERKQEQMELIELNSTEGGE
jgi:methyl-accepting chemotaxis protein